MFKAFDRAMILFSSSEYASGSYILCEEISKSLWKTVKEQVYFGAEFFEICVQFFVCIFYELFEDNFV